MARSRGYSSYRGRRSKGKAALAAVLVLVILAAVVVILLQKHIVYDETGTPHLEVPWQEETVQEEETADLDLVIQTPEKTVGEIRAFSMPVGQLTKTGCDSALATADPACDAVAVTLKDETGTVYFDAAVAVHDSVDVAADTGTALAELTSREELHTIAKISCFRDSKAANTDVDGMGLMNVGGFIFYDGANSQWLDPAKPAARKYLCDLAVEAAKLGFDEILLTDVSYPADGKLEKISYGEVAKNVNLLEFLKEMKAALEPYGTIVSVEVSAGVIMAGQEETTGLVLKEIASEADRIYAAVQPEEEEALFAAVKSASSATMFVPELAEAKPSGSYLIL